MENIVWGDEIAIVGGRPDWVSGRQRVDVQWNDEGWYADSAPYRAEGVSAENISGWDLVTVIRLPADHPHYAREFKVGDYVVALDFGMDITKGGVYTLDSVVGNSLFFDDDVSEERQRPSEEFRPATPAEIAEYLAEHALEAQYKGEPLPLAVPTVTLPMMTREECLAKADEKEWSTPSTSRMAYLHAYEDLGLIAPPPSPPTDIERYIAEKGELTPYERSLAEAAIKWARGNS